MIKRHIYAKDNFSIVKVKVEINEKILYKLLKEINEFYKIREKTYKDENKKTLSDILTDIINCKNNLKLSYLIGNLLNYEYKSKEEYEFLNQSLLCFHFFETKNIPNFRQAILNWQYKIDLNAIDPYYVDENSISKNIDDLPFLKTK